MYLIRSACSWSGTVDNNNNNDEIILLSFGLLSVYVKMIIAIFFLNCTYFWVCQILKYILKYVKILTVMTDAISQNTTTNLI